MNRAPAEKWLGGLGPDDRLSDAAERALQSRFGAVLHYLPQAAGQTDQNGEPVHQLRVWARRATAALRLYEELLPHRGARWLRKQLRKIRRAAGEARDCDVILRRLRKAPPSDGSKRWLATARAEREQAQKAIVAIHGRLGRGRLARRIDRFVQRLRARAARGDSTEQPRYADWAHERLRGLVEWFFRAVPGDCAGGEALHRFRIRCKALRYAMELLAAAFGASFRTTLYPAVEALQDRLGEINDLATATARLRRKVEKAGDPAEAGPWRHLLAEEEARFDEARRQFGQWCSAERLARLHEGFEEVLGGPPGTRWSRRLSG
jgi:CHAD domain-containing protein